MLNKEQRDFLSLIASHAQKSKEIIIAKNMGDLEATAPELMRLLPCDPGVARK